MKPLLILLAVQATLVGVYFLVERARAPEATFAVEQLEAPAPPLSGESQSGPIDLAAFSDEAVLVHFWATWCVPCREELPGLIAAARAERVVLLAVTDEPWATVADFFGGTIPAEIVRDPGGEAARRYAVSGLPDTFVVEGGVRMSGRMGGARDWFTPRARAFLQSLRKP